MRLSARNVIRGRVTGVTIGAVNAEVTVEVAPGLELTSIITRASCEKLGLEIGTDAWVVIKASNVMIGVD
ncbi:MAG TPA: molybdopterin-binding protein [bacterium]|nr:molybdopterin-binding protein [bacterium]